MKMKVDLVNGALRRTRKDSFGSDRLTTSTEDDESAPGTSRSLLSTWESEVESTPESEVPHAVVISTKELSSHRSEIEAEQVEDRFVVERWRKAGGAVGVLISPTTCSEEDKMLRLSRQAARRGGPHLGAGARTPLRQAPRDRSDRDSQDETLHHAFSECSGRASTTSEESPEPWSRCSGVNQSETEVDGGTGRPQQQEQHQLPKSSTWSNDRGGCNNRNELDHDLVYNKHRHAENTTLVVSNRNSGTARGPAPPLYRGSSHHSTASSADDHYSREVIDQRKSHSTACVFPKRNAVSAVYHHESSTRAGRPTSSYHQYDYNRGNYGHAATSTSRYNSYNCNYNEGHHYGRGPSSQYYDQQRSWGAWRHSYNSPNRNRIEVDYYNKDHATTASGAGGYTHQTLWSNTSSWSSSTYKHNYSSPACIPSENTAMASWANLKQLSRKHLFNAASFHKYSYFAILDFESTCEWDHSLDPEVIEFPTVILDAETLEVVAEFREYVRPVVNPNLTRFCTTLTGIRQETVNQADYFPNVYARWKQFIGQYPNALVITCGDWDVETMLPGQLRHSNLHDDVERTFCNIKIIFANLLGDPRKHKSYNYYKRKEACGLTLEGRHHSGLDDSRNIAKIVRYLVENYGEHVMIPTMFRGIRKLERIYF
ncbi:unnamed protein product [Amoebophrya sp. A25]|nr:unnamed protein product [Amoebophrya sp. A25]|eukprot:GSA25T00009501001.1